MYNKSGRIKWRKKFSKCTIKFSNFKHFNPEYLQILDMKPKRPPQNRYDIMILGLTPSGLFLLGEFSRVGKKILAVGLKGNVGLYSKYGNKVALSKIKEIEDFFKIFTSEYKYPYMQWSIFKLPNWWKSRPLKIWSQPVFYKYHMP